MAKTDYITLISNKARLYVYQSDIQNSTSSDPYVNVTVYLQYYRSSSATSSYFVNTWNAGLLSDTYTSSRTSATGYISDSWTGWKTVDTVFSSKGIWSVSKTRTAFNVRFAGTIQNVAQTSQYVSVNQNVTMQTWPVSGTKDTMSVASSMTMGTSYTVTITHKTSGNKNTLTWKFGSQSGTLLTKATNTSVTFSPATSLGSQIPSSSSGTVTFTLTTYNSAGTNLGSSTYTATLSVPSYSLAAPTVSAAKNTYTSVNAYVANKTKTRFTLSGLPSGSYGATVTGSYVIKLGSTQQTSGSKTGTSASNVDYVAPAAGTLTLTYTIKDSRGKSNSASASVTYVANAAPTISFSVGRDSTTPTNWSGTATGTYLNVSGNTATITFSAGTAGSNSASSGNVSRSVSGTLAETSTLNVTATVTDSLGNTAAITKSVTTVFAYMEATPNKVISIGRKADVNATNRIQMGLPTYFDDKVYGVPMLSRAGAANTDALSGQLINLGELSRTDLGLVSTSATEEEVITAFLKYVCARYPAATSCTFSAVIVPNSKRMMQCFVYDTSVVSGGLPQYATGTMLYYNGTPYIFGTSSYTVFVHKMHDYVIEEGASGSWSYRKWKSGVYECWMRKTMSIAVSSAWQSSYYGQVAAQSYPVTFNSSPYEQVSVTGGDGWAWVSGGASLPTTTTTGVYYLVRPVSTSAQNYTLDYYVRGTVSS